MSLLRQAAIPSGAAAQARLDFQLKMSFNLQFLLHVANIGGYSVIGLYLSCRYSPEQRNILTRK